MMNEENNTTPPVNQDPEQQHIAEPQIDYKNLYLRVNADLQNLKKRAERERADLRLMVQVETIEKFLPVVNDLERALQAAPTQGAEQVWMDGFALILKNYKKQLADLGVEEIVAQATFNPELHEALVHVESSEHESGTIVQVLEKGYTLKGRVIKYARVSVAK